VVLVHHGEALFILRVAWDGHLPFVVPVLEACRTLLFLVGGVVWVCLPVVALVHEGGIIVGGGVQHRVAMGTPVKASLNPLAHVNSISHRFVFLFSLGLALDERIWGFSSD
jgi:hypothetical protein